MGKTETSETQEILAEMLRDGLSIEPLSYLAYVYGPPECWPKDQEAALSGVFKTVSEDDKIGAVQGSA